jgi:hypothetical protein
MVRFAVVTTTLGTCLDNSDGSVPFLDPMTHCAPRSASIAP